MVEIPRVLVSDPKMQVPGALALPYPASQVKIVSSQWVSVISSVKTRRYNRWCPRPLCALRFWDPMAHAIRGSRGLWWPSPARGIPLQGHTLNHTLLRALLPWPHSGSQAATYRGQAPPLPGPQENKALNKYKAAGSWSQRPRGMQVHCCGGAVAPAAPTVGWAFSFPFRRAAC